MERLFLQVLNMSVTASWVIVAVLVLRLVLARAPKIWSYALWAVVFFRLLCPFSLESVLSLVPVRAQTIPEDIGYARLPTIESGLPMVDRVVNSPLPAAEPVASVNPLQIYLLVGKAVWLLGMVFLLAASAWSLWRLCRRLQPAREEEAGVYTVSGLTTPFVLGLVRPRIYLPEGLEEGERDYILLHEQTHIARRDHWAKLVAFAALCLHWFNPLVWLSFYLLSKDMEMSCDEQVLRKMGAGIKKAYSSSLLRLAVEGRAWSGTPLAFGESDVKSRIKHILRYQKPASWLVLLAAAVLIAAVVSLTTNQRQETQDLSFLNPDNLIALAADQPEVQINPYLWDSYVYVQGQQAAQWIDETQWQRLKTPPENLPQVTYSLENLQGGEVCSEIHLFADAPTVAAVLYGQDTAYYTINEEAYGSLETLIFRDGGSSRDQVIHISARIAELLDEIESEPLVSSAPSDYISAHQEAFEELLSYGDTTLLYCFNRFENNGPFNNLRGHILAAICQALAGEAENTAFDVSTGQAWYEAFKAQTLSQAETVELDELEKHQPVAYLLLEYLYRNDKDLVGAWPYQMDKRFAAERNGLVTMDSQMPEPTVEPNDILLPAYRYAGDDPVEQLVYETIAGRHSDEQLDNASFGIYAVQVIDQYTDGDYLKVFCIYYAGGYHLYGQEVVEESGAILAEAFTYHGEADGSYTLLQRQRAQDGSYFEPSIEKYCTLPVSGRTIPGLAERILHAYSDHEPLLELARQHLIEHLENYGQTGVSLVTTYDDTVTPLT